MLNTKRQFGSLICLMIATGTHSLATTKPTDSNKDQQTIKVDIIASSILADETLGKTTLTSDEISVLTTGNSTTTDIAYTMPNILFSDTYNDLSESNILDTRPPKISISGGHSYDNNFVLDGIRTNSLHDTTEDIISETTLVVHPQTIFVNPDLVDSVTVYDSNVPASYGHFTGGVFEIKTKDPSGEFHSGFSFGMESSETMKYVLVAPEGYASSENSERPNYTKYQYSAYVDTPITQNTAIMFQYSRQKSDLKNQQPKSLYSKVSRSTHSYTDNYQVNVKTELNDISTIKFSSIYTPSELRDIENSLIIQKDTGFQNQVEYMRETMDSTLNVSAAYQTSDMGRLAAQDSYIYAATASTDWSSNYDMAARGSFGDLNAKEHQIPIKVDYTYQLTDTAKFKFGAEYDYEYAETIRPQTNTSYYMAITGDNIISADGEDDPTVIDGEQALTIKQSYPAYDVDASINNYAMWSEFSDEWNIAGTKLSYRLGLRYDYEDYLKNSNLAPRLTTTWSPIEWLDITLGWNRYYAGNFLAYKLNAAEPNSQMYFRFGNYVDGKEVYSSEDWILLEEYSSIRLSDGGVNTPYSDETTLATTFHTALGDLTLQYLDRKSRDEFAKSTLAVTDEDDMTYYDYHITNDGHTDYQAFSFNWSKQWKNHEFALNGTFSETKSTNDDYLTIYDESELNELVYYNNGIVRYETLLKTRDDYGSPDYLNLRWTSYWLKNRLSLTLSGRLELGYDSIRRNGNIDVQDSSYKFFEDYHIKDYYMLNLNTSWVVYDSTDKGTVTLSFKLRNILNQKHDSGEIHEYAYYAQGRSLWTGISYNF